MHILNNRHIRLTEENRLYHCDVPIIGITGSIATGKSTVTEYLQNKNFKIIDADLLVKSIYKKSSTIDFIKSITPDAIHKNEIDFKVLRKSFFSNAETKSEVERFIYKQLPSQFNESKAQLELKPGEFIFYDVPLLFEKKLDKHLDQIVTVYTPQVLQIERLKLRDNIGDELVNKILSTQLSIEEKKQKADFVLDNSQSIKELHSGIENLIKKLCK